MTYLVKAMHPETTGSYKGIKVSFYDHESEVIDPETGARKIELYIAIDNMDDPYSKIRRKPTSKKVPSNAFGDLKEAREIDLYGKTFAKYTVLKMKHEAFDREAINKENENKKLLENLKAKEKKNKELERRLQELNKKETNEVK